MLFGANWKAIWLRLAPLWLSLWFVASFGGPASAWQHFDGTLCNTCTFAASAPVLDDDCETALPQRQQHAEPSVGAPDDCQKCCAPTSRNAPDKLISHASHAAILGIAGTFSTPAQRETRLTFAFESRRLDALPRPPPRGRAPPFLFSISPF